MAELQIRKWVSPKDGQVRYYLNTRRLWHSDELKYADGCYIRATEDGGARVKFPPNPSGLIGMAAHAAENYLGLLDMTFAEWERRYEGALTPGGNWSAVRYFKSAQPIAA